MFKLQLTDSHDKYITVKIKTCNCQSLCKFQSINQSWDQSDQSLKMKGTILNKNTFNKKKESRQVYSEWKKNQRKCL